MSREQDAIVEKVGAENWRDIQIMFGDDSVDEIYAELNNMFSHEASRSLAVDIFGELR